LGGSFNPAHEGHLHISLEALKRLGLDEVWWLVSPQNPLKPVKGMASQAERIAGAVKMARHPRLKVTGMEADWGTRYTADTLAVMKKRFPAARLVWLMGADNLRQVSRWDRWMRIFRSVPVAVFDRSPYSRESMASKAARRFSPWRVAAPGRLIRAALPSWTFMHIKRHPASATEIRRRLVTALKERSN
jgi:nicotinate-nucleotide adenylyltransferase